MSIIALNGESKITRALLKNWYKLHKVRVSYKRKINKIYVNIMKKQIYSDIKLDINKHTEKWNVLNKRINPYWYRTYSYISGIDDINYVPEDLFYGIIEPALNDFSLTSAYADKNFYNKYYPDLDIFPETLLRNINGIFYDSNYEYLKDNIENYFKDEMKIIVKPSLDSGGGRKVHIFYRKNDNFYYNNQGEKFSINYLNKNLERDYLIQKCIESGDYFRKLNETSLNTVRIFTYRSVKTNNVIINNSVLRIGKKGSEVDNQASGGISCFIDKNGQLSKYAIDKYGNKYFYLPSNLDTKFSDLSEIPKFNEIKEIAKEIAKRNYYHRLLGLDFCVDSKDNIKLVEINNQENEINFFQMFGSSLFGEYTDEVIEYCLAKNS
ncbi:MAG: sugar-transfer associated ATP-grasp domain-containing protein [Candidatus Gastranaerophilales bacterium]|nr:sugar-transfer associated ATP-grasp domain-containing protein [Candidatus Gastranaerophilales bacterium]